MPLFDASDHADVERTYDADPWPGLVGLTDRELAVYRFLWTCSEPGTDVAQVRHKKIALGVRLKPDKYGSRQVRRLMDNLSRRGLVLPIKQTAPMPGGGRRRVSNRYRLLVPLHALPPPTVRTWPRPSSSQVAPLGHEYRGKPRRGR
jgi:hypothetical protein